LEERNTIEMQAVTALAHIRSAILYIMDVSEQCTYSLEEQLELFNSIRPLFANKPVLVGANKVDVMKIADLPPEKRAIFEGIEKLNIPVIQMSTMTQEGIMDLRNEACDRLLSTRVEQKMKGKKVGGILNRLYVAEPKQRDEMERPPCIPEAVMRKRAGMEIESEDVPMKKKLERDIEMEMGDDYILDLKKNYLIKPDEKYDKIPEIWEGHNIADFVDPNIKSKLTALLEEEHLRVNAGLYDDDMDSDDDDTREMRKQAKIIRRKQVIITKESREKRSSTKPKAPRIGRKRERSRSRLESEMQELGVDLRAKKMHHLSDRSLSRVVSVKKARLDPSTNRVRSSSRAVPRDEQGLKDETQFTKVKKIANKAQKPRQRAAMAGEGDRRIIDKMPKHLFAGKRGMGKTDRR